MPPPLPAPKPARPPEYILRRLFLTMFLRGRSSRGLKKSSAPRSVGEKLALTLAVYFVMGLFALVFMRQPVFGMSIYLHGMTMAFVGLFVAASSGEILFNKEEADILLHRPVAPRALLIAKVRVLVEVSLWLAGAFNLAGLFGGIGAVGGTWRFPLVHAVSTVMEALFCTGAVVLGYQLCLRWFGRERLDGLMTTAQVIVAVVAVFGSQLAPQVMARYGDKLNFNFHAWWIGAVPPAWFAGIDDALAGSASATSFALAGVAVVVTAAVIAAAFGRLAGDYAAGLQKLGESVSPPARRSGGRRRWLGVLVNVPPLSWWLRDSVSRASFLLTAAYLARDRDVKLRIYPGVAPLLMFPVFLMLQGRGHAQETDVMGRFSVSFGSVYLGIVPMLGLNLLRYSQQWQAADLFRVAPLPFPAPLCHGARRAVLFCLTIPVVALMALLAWLLRHSTSELVLLLPGILAIPVFALVPCLGGAAVPLSQPPEEAKSAGRGVTMIAVMMISMALSGIAAAAWWGGWLPWFLLGECLVIIGAYAAMRQSIATAPWEPME